MARFRVPTAAAALLLSLTGCVGTDSDDPGASASRQPRRCFTAREARNFAPVDSTTVNLRVGRDVFRIDTFGTCRDLEWTSRMALVTRGSSLICAGSGLGASIVTRGTSGRQTCQIRAITALTPEEVAALPARARP